MENLKRGSLYLLALFLVFGGFNHLMNPGFYVAIMPPELPNPEWLNVLSGLAEIVLGVFVLEPRVRVICAWGIIALLIAIFPANMYAATNAIGPDGPGTANATAAYVRLPFQALFILWAWWYTRPDSESA